MSSTICATYIRIIPIRVHEGLLPRPLALRRSRRAARAARTRIFFSVGGSTQHSAVAPHSGLSAHAPDWWAREALITWNET